MMHANTPHNDNTAPATSGWDKSALRKFYDGQSPERRDDDAQRLSRVFNLAAKSESVKEALEWAAANDIDIVIDRTSRGVGGYYMNGTGVVALSEPAFWDDAKLAGVIVHEIRHAWQDKQKLIATAEYRLDHYIIKNALIEADATAHQRLAEQQVRVHDGQLHIEKLAAHGFDTAWQRKDLAARTQEIADPNTFLLEQFRGWYAGTLPSVYGRAATQRFARQHGMTDVKPPDWNLEMPMIEVPAGTGVDFSRMRSFRKLGERYDGSNYFKSADMKRVKGEQLSPVRARIFFNKAALADRKLVKEVVRRENSAPRRLVNPWAA